MPLAVFYDERQVAELPGNLSPSSGTPKHVVADWQACGAPIGIHPVTPVTRNDLVRAHAPEFVDEILSCQRENGFGNRSAEVAAALPFTSGSLLGAARHALAHGVACSPTSGFHHAMHDEAMGFCTFNGLMVAAHALQADGAARTIGILDLDVHYGNGTDDIIRRTQFQPVVHYTLGAGRRSTPDRMMRGLPGVCELFAECDIVLYQAGADLWAHDPLCDPMYGLSLEQLAERDRIVFEWAARSGVPIAWNLAGGYSRDDTGSIEPVLRIHRQTVVACCRAFGFVSAG